MDDKQLTHAARGIAPYLDWVSSTDGDGHQGTGIPFVGATVGTTIGAGTVNLAWIGGVWVAELVIHEGSVSTPGGVERSAVVQTTGCRTAPEAWASLLEMCKGAGSFELGLAAAENAQTKTHEQRMAAIGLVGVEMKVGGAAQ